MQRVSRPQLPVLDQGRTNNALSPNLSTPVMSYAEDYAFVLRHVHSQEPGSRPRYCWNEGGARLIFVGACWKRG